VNEEAHFSGGSQNGRIFGIPRDGALRVALRDIARCDQTPNKMHIQVAGVSIPTFHGLVKVGLQSRGCGDVA